MATKSSRGSRGGRRVQRGRARGLKTPAEDEEALAEARLIEEYERLADQAHAIYTAAFVQMSGLCPYPPSVTEQMFRVPLPNDWLLEITSGEDGPLFPPGHENGNDFVFWLITPEGLFAEEDDRRCEGADETLIPSLVSAHACRLLWRHLGEILGEEDARSQRRGLPRAEAQKIKALVERGSFKQPSIAGDFHAQDC